MEERNDCVLLLVGEGSEKKNIELLVNKWQIEKNVIFLQILKTHSLIRVFNLLLCLKYFIHDEVYLF